jgi:hypothetical protein
MSNAGRKVCSGCGRELAPAEFVRDRRKPDGYGSACRECVSEPAGHGATRET